MSGATPSLVRRQSRFPPLIPKPPQPHPIPLPRRRPNFVYGYLNQVRDLQREMDDLSEEENELEDLNLTIHNRGYTWLIPIGKTLTQQEEKNDQADDDDGEDAEDEEFQSNGAPSPGGEEEDADGEGDEEGEDDEGVDLDASMEDLDDDPLGADMATEDTLDDLLGVGDFTDEYEEEPNEFL